MRPGEGGKGGFFEQVMRRVKSSGVKEVVNLDQAKKRMRPGGMVRGIVV